MKLLISCLVLAAAALFTFSDAVREPETKTVNLPKASTRENVVVINNETFYLGSNTYTWYDAKAQCNLLGMQLVTVDTQERWEMIKNWLLQNPEYDYWTWTSGQKPSGQTDFFWTTTGENFTYTAWNAGEPSEHYALVICMDFVADFFGKSGWDDDACSFLLQYMCEARSV